MSNYPAESFEKYIVPALFGPWSNELMKFARPAPGERVLDVACGTGAVTRNVANRIGANAFIAGLDFNSKMLRVARVTAQQQGLGIEWCTGRAEQLPLPGSRFDLVTCQFWLMLFPDRQAALAEMRRVLRKGGRVCLSVWQSLEKHPFYQALEELGRRRLGISMNGRVFTLGDAGELARLMTEAGFRHVEIEPVSIMAQYVAPEEFLAWEVNFAPEAVASLQHLDEPARQAILEDLRAKMRIALEEYMDGPQAVMPYHAHIAHAVR